MSVRIDYSGVPNAEEQAIRDLREFIGNERFDLLLSFFEDPTMTYAQFAFACDLAGVRGFPVTALWRKLREE